MQKKKEKNKFLNLEHSSTPKPPILPYAFQIKPILQKGKKKHGKKPVVTSRRS